MLLRQEPENHFREFVLRSEMPIHADGNLPPEESPSSADVENRSKKTPKTLKEHDKWEYCYVLGAGFSLSFSAGYTNAAALSGWLQRGHEAEDSPFISGSVAGVTGIYTLAALQVGEGDFSEASFHAATIASLCVGACMASLLNPYAIAFELGPKYGPSFWLASILMTLGALCAHFDLTSHSEFYFTIMANGVQNGMSSLYSANLLRTTHLTGTTTDIGLLIGQSLRGNRTNEWKLWILLGLAISFWSGSFVGYYASKYGRAHALWANVAFFFLIGCSLMIYFIRVHHVPVWQAILGTANWGTQVHARKSGTTNASDGEKEELMNLFDEVDSQQLGYVNTADLLKEADQRPSMTARRRESVTAILTEIEAPPASEEEQPTIDRHVWDEAVQRHHQTHRRSSLACSGGPNAIRLHSRDQYLDAGFTVE